MLTRRRAILLATMVAVSAAGYTAWLAVQVRGDLAEAERAGERLQVAYEHGDRAARDEALTDFRSAAASAEQRTSGVWWSFVAHLPLVGDDATGVRALSESLNVVATDGAAPLGEAVDLLDGLSRDGRIDVKVLGRLRTPVADARAAFAEAAGEVRGLDSSGYAGSVRTRFEEYVDIVTNADRLLTSAETASQVLPGMVGADAPRNYLLIFQNNAEIRATGGMPGSWAFVHADRGALRIQRQGSALPSVEEPILPLSQAEVDVYDRQLGTYWQDASFTPDYPRAAELLAAHYEQRFPGSKVDGVISLDPVAMSYLLPGTGPVRVGDLTLTSDSVVDELLSKPYQDLDPIAQNRLFRAVAKAVFGAATGDLADPVEFVKGLGRAADEGRFLVASFHENEREALAGTRVLGDLADGDGRNPHVDIGLNDATGSKMSYYLRYSARVRSSGCSGDRQQLGGSMSLSQAIDPSEAAHLPDSVTGGGAFGTSPGSQLVLVRVYGPNGGTVEDIRMDGKAIKSEVVMLDGRPVVTLVVLLSSTDDVVINWSMETGPGQTGAGRLGMTPSIVPGNNDAEFATSC